MLGFKQTETTIVYLANAPYTRQQRLNEDPLAVDPTFADIQKEFVAHIVRWCLEKNLVRQQDDGIVPEVDKNIGSLSYILHIKNFQYLRFRDTLEDFIKMITDNGSFDHTTALHQLTIFLLGFFEPNFIHYHINRVYRAFDALPVGMEDFTWADLHARYPFLWVVLTIHLILKNYTNKE